MNWFKMDMDIYLISNWSNTKGTDNVGGVSLVTSSEHVARQSIVNAMNGQDETTNDSPLWSGY